MAQGSAFLRGVTAGWPEVGMAVAAALGAGAAYPVAVGATLAQGGIPVAEGLAAYLNAVVTGLIGAGMRLVPLGKRAACGRCLRFSADPGDRRTRPASTLDDLGSAASSRTSNRCATTSLFPDLSLMTASANGPLRVGIGGQ